MATAKHFTVIHDNADYMVSCSFGSPSSLDAFGNIVSSRPMLVGMVYNAHIITCHEVIQLKVNLLFSFFVCFLATKRSDFPSLLYYYIISDTNTSLCT